MGPKLSIVHHIRIRPPATTYLRSRAAHVRSTTTCTSWHPTLGTYYLFPEETTPIDTFGGRSFIINYKGQIVGRQDYGAGSTYVAGVIDIEALRDHRARAQWDNWMKDLR